MLGRSPDHVLAECATIVSGDEQRMRKQTVRRAKIVATIGPASWDEDVLAELLRADRKSVV